MPAKIFLNLKKSPTQPLRLAKEINLLYLCRKVYQALKPGRLRALHSQYLRDKEQSPFKNNFQKLKPLVLGFKLP